jgi:hypothetical protein
VSVRWSRRTLLRSSGGALLGLPFLEALAPRAARAQGKSTPPKRFIVFYTSNGTVKRDWRPTTMGPGFELPPIFRGFTDPRLRSKLSLISGIDMASAHERGGGNGHAVGMTNMLTGRAFTEVTPTEFGEVGWGGGISIDQELARRMAAPGQLPSLQLGVQTQKQYSDFYAYMSYAAGGGSTNAVPSDDDPRRTYQRVFAGVPDAGAVRAELERKARHRRSVLDLVYDDFRQLRGKLPRADQQRLDRHAELVLELEGRVGIGPYCDKPGLPMIRDADVQRTAMFPTIGRTQMDLLAIALSCDLVRVAGLQWSSAQSGTVFESFIPGNWSSLPETYHHGISHAAAASDEQNLTPVQRDAMGKLTSINTWYADQLAYLATRLADLEELDGSSVLDHTAILWVTEVQEGPSHSFDDMPYVLVGDLGGRLAAGQHFDFQDRRTHNDLFVTVGQALGLADFDTFGDPRYVTGPISALLR